jgi:hypothetical protein
MIRPRAVLACSLLLTLPAAAWPGVVINEILYHAPNDLDDLQFIELHNTDGQIINMSGWKLARGVHFDFPEGSKIEAGGYLVVCKDAKEFKRHYGFDAAGVFTGTLSHRGERVTLVDAKGREVDSVRYGSRTPWPVAADGYSSSLERICPTTKNTGPENWSASPLTGTQRPGGTPGKKNSVFALRLPPIVRGVTIMPSHLAPGQEAKVTAEVRSPFEVQSVELRYRIAGSGYENEEKSLPMARNDKDRFTAILPGQKANQIIRFRIRAVDSRGTERFYPHANDVRPAVSVYVHENIQPLRIPQGYIIHVGKAEFQRGQAAGGFGFRFGGGPSANPPARGNSAFVYVDAGADTPELFDFINVHPRSAGRRVRFHKDHSLRGMTTISLVYEMMDRFVLAEPMAFEVYRKAGNAACRTDFVRTWVDGRPIGYQLLIEQPNRAFLRRNKLRADGNLYKIIWFGNGLVGQHEKKTNVHKGHDDLIKLVDQMNRTKGDEQWAVIKKNFDVEQVINYFAVNMILSHWDGFFNNYFAYHDVHGTGKWTMYPWDQDKTWGYHDGVGPNGLFFDMPLTFGMEGDRPPGQNQGGFFFFGSWWRPGGHFSKPLLANPHFRKPFLARTKELLETIYTKDVFFPLIKDMNDRLEDEVRYRAKLRNEDPKQALDQFHRNIELLRTHLTRRRDFLLRQDEIKNAGRFDRNALK